MLFVKLKSLIMKNLYQLTFLLIFIFSTSSFAQNDTIWYDANWNKAQKKQASYFRPQPVEKNNGYWWVDYYISGAKQMEALSLNKDQEQFEGQVTWYYENGNIMQIVNYKNNSLYGLRKNYHESGPLKSQYSYIDGKIEGERVEYYDNAKLSESGFYENGERNGLWNEYFRDGKLKGEGKYLNDKKVGVWNMYYYDGIN